MTEAEQLQKSESTGRVLLYLRTGEDVSILQDMLAAMAAEGEVCTDIEDLRQRMGQEDVDTLLLTEAALRDGALAILAEMLRNQPPWSDLPVLFVTSGGLESPLAVRVRRELPNVLILERPVRIATLTSAVQMALRVRSKQRQVRDLLDERRRAEEALENANERLHAQADDLAAANEQLLTEREELQRQSLGLRQLRNQAERATHAMESLARLVEENPDPALRVRADGRILYKNPASFHLCREWNAEDQQRVPPAVQEMVSEAYDRTQVIRREMAFGECTYLMTAAPAPPKHVNIFARDITERKRAEEALRESEERLHRAMESGKVGVWEWEVGTDNVQWSQGVYTLLGCRPAEVPPSLQAIRQRMDPRDLAHHDQALKDSLERCEDYLSEFRVVWADGSVHWLAARGQYVYVDTPDGTVLRLRGVFVDIDQRKQTEEALRRSEEQFHRLFEEDLTGNFVSTPDGRILLCNPAFAAIFGFSRAVDAVGTNIVDSYLASQERLPLLERLKAEGKIERLEVWRRRRDGQPIHIVENLVGHLNEQGELDQIKGYLFEDTVRKQAEEALHDLNATLENKVAQRTTELQHRTRQLQKLALEMSKAEDEERERLAHILHDDLQQELAAAKFHLSIVRSRVMHDSSLHDLTTQVHEMLKDAIGKSRSLSHELRPAVLHQDDFAEILFWLANEMQAKHGLTIHVQGRARVASDPIKAFLYRTAQELLFNAVKHAQVNEAKARVRQCGGYVCLAVSDRGRGFDPETLREAAGFGLLSIRERIELLGGHMKIRSAPGRGSTFFVIVPGSETAAPLSGRTEDAERSLAQDDGRLRVVLADDHDIVRQGLAALLSEEDTMKIVGEATNGHEAVELAERLHPDVVIMDVSMPVMSGEEAARRIKNHLPQTRIVALSMREESETRERMCEAGAESYILKTAPYKELLAAIRGQEPDS